MSTAKTIYQMKVTLISSKPPIWRRFLVADTTTLYRLHAILRAVMGWQDYHLHMFTVDGQIYGDPEDDEDGDLGTKNEARFKLDQFVRGEGSKVPYEYDFGDSWEHHLIVERILPVQQGLRYLLCTAVLFCTAMERMVIDRLAEFGCLACEYRTRTSNDFRSR